MQSNVMSTQPVIRTNIKSLTQKLIPHTPIQKQQEGLTTVKKIQNFSYALSDEIGLGLTSKVYKGKNDLTGLPVAIKCIDLKKQNDQLNQQFLKQQIATLQKIRAFKTAYLLRLQGVVLTSNNLYIITQLCEGKDMGKILRQKKTLSEKQAQSIMRQMIWGYRQLYGMGLIHRDLKLSNLFVTGNKIKIADFGFAISQDKCNQSFTYNAGSPKYMPPQSLKYNRYSFKSDAWSMGVMAYQLVYGHAPWQSLDEAKLYNMTTTIPIEGLLDKNIEVSDHYKSFIVNCLKPSINQRANSDFIFNFVWPLAQNFVQGYEEQKKIPEVIKVPGKNYAVFKSDNKIQYQTKQLDVENFVSNSSTPTKFIIINQLSYCRFLMDILKNIKTLYSKENNQLLMILIQEISLSVQILMKVLGELTCMQKNKLGTEDFESFIKTGQWQNLKQLVIRYDLQFRGQLQSNQPPSKHSVLPQTSILPQTISYLKKTLPQNARLIDKLITYFEVRQILASSSPFQFAQKVSMQTIVKKNQIPDSDVSKQAVVKGVLQRLSVVGL